MALPEVAAAPSPPTDDPWGWQLRHLRSVPDGPHQELLQEEDGGLLLVRGDMGSVVVSRLGPEANSWKVLAEYHDDDAGNFWQCIALLVTPNLLMVGTIAGVFIYLLFELDTKAWRRMAVQLDHPNAPRLLLSIHDVHVRGGRALLLDGDLAVWELQPATGRCKLLGDPRDAVPTAHRGGEQVVNSGRYVYLLGDTCLSRLDVSNCAHNAVASTCSPAVPPKDYVMVFSVEDGPRTVAVTDHPSLQLHLLHFDTGHGVSVPFPRELQRAAPWMCTYLLGMSNITLWDGARTVATLPAVWQWRPEWHPFYPRPTQHRVRAVVLSLTRQGVSMDLILTACGFLDPLGL